MNYGFRNKFGMTLAVENRHPEIVSGSFLFLLKFILNFPIASRLFEISRQRKDRIITSY